jgi:hypothetical protein
LKKKKHTKGEKTKEKKSAHGEDHKKHDSKHEEEEEDPPFPWGKVIMGLILIIVVCIGFRSLIENEIWPSIKSSSLYEFCFGKEPAQAKNYAGVALNQNQTHAAKASTEDEQMIEFTPIENEGTTWTPTEKPWTLGNPGEWSGPLQIMHGEPLKVTSEGGKSFWVRIKYPNSQADEYVANGIFTKNENDSSEIFSFQGDEAGTKLVFTTYEKNKN